MEYRSHKDSNIVEIIVEGKIAKADFDHLLEKVDTDFTKHGKLRVLEDIRSFEGIDPMALWQDFRQIRRINDVTHAAIVVDAKWLRTVAEAISGLYPFEMKVFEAILLRRGFANANRSSSHLAEKFIIVTIKGDKS